MSRAFAGAGVAIRAAVAVLLAGCALAVPGSGAARPSDGTPATREIAIDGATWRVLSAGADGMRGRTDFGEGAGMLFDMAGEVRPSAVAFVMDGVHIPLDIAWFAGDGRLLGIARMAPCAAEPCPRYVAPAPFRWAIEAPVGAFDQLADDATLDLTP